MMEPRQSTTVPKVSKSSAFTGGAAAVAPELSVACKAIAAMPIPADVTIPLRVIAKVPANHYSGLRPGTAGTTYGVLRAS